MHRTTWSDPVSLPPRAVHRARRQRRPGPGAAA
eukprot:ctg_5509.g684